MTFVSRPLKDRIGANITTNGDCWVWQSKRDRHGYGLIELRGAEGGRRSRYLRVAHVVSYEAHVGPVPDGLELDHLCRIRACVNPAHLEPVTRSVNQQRAVPFNTKDTCVRDHPFTPENTRLRGTRRICRACERIRSHAYRTRRAS